MDMAEQVIELQDAYRALVGADRSAALSAFGAAFLKRYTDHKHQRGWLDFDDLIGKARALLSDKGVAAWVLYRICLLYTSPRPRDRQKSRRPSSA